MLRHLLGLCSLTGFAKLVARCRSHKARWACAVVFGVWLPCAGVWSTAVWWLVALVTGSVFAESSSGPLIAGRHGARGADWGAVESAIQMHRERVRMCGPLSAARVIQGWGLRLKEGFWEEARARLTAEGVPLRQVVDWCREANPTARGVLFAGKLDRSRLLEIPLPGVVVVNDGHHCLVLESVSQDSTVVRVWDPSDLKSKPMPVEQLLEMWNGAAIIADKGAAVVEPIGREERRWLLLGGCGLAAQSWAVWRCRRGAGRLEPCAEG